VKKPNGGKQREEKQKQHQKNSCASSLEALPQPQYSALSCVRFLSLSFLVFSLFPLLSRSLQKCGLLLLASASGPRISAAGSPKA
jgi:hypothetical protein